LGWAQEAKLLLKEALLLEIYSIKQALLLKRPPYKLLERNEVSQGD